MKRKVLAGVAVAVAVLVIIIVSHPESRHAGKGAVTQRPHVSSRPSTQSPSNTGVEREDARGDLVLEGQVLDSASQPVGGVSVSLNAFPPRTIVTEEDGSFSFTGLIERRYQVTAASASGVAGPVEISLQANTDPLILRLVRPGRVVVKVVNAASQAPIAGATVDVRTPIVVTGQTRADGTVELSPVVQGHWDVVATAADHARGHSAVVVTSEQATATIALEQGGSLRGRAVDNKGNPVAHARVWAVSSSDWTDVSSPDRDGAETQDDGTFELVGLKPGTYRIHARARGFADTASREISAAGAVTNVGDIVLDAGATLHGRVVHKDGTPVPGAQVEAYIKTGLSPTTRAGRDGAFVIDDLPRAKVLVTASTVSAGCWARPVDLTSGTGEITLTLDLAGWIGGSVVDGSGAPIEGAQVSISLMKEGARFVRSNMTDGGGGFRFAGLPEGDYEAIATRPEVTASERDPKVVGHTGTSVKLVLGASGSVKGKVTFADATPPSLVIVRLGANGAPRTFHGGTFEIADVAPGSYDLRIEGPEIASAAPTTAVVAEGKVIDLGTIRADRGRSIDGIVVDSAGRPVAGSEVVAGNVIVGTGATVESGTRAPAFQPGLKRTTTDADGKFVLRGLAPVALSIVASHSKAGRSPPQTLSADASASLRIVLAPTSSLSGTVTADGGPTNAAVIAQPAASPLALALVFAGADGTFHYDNLAAGRYSVSAAAGDPLGGAPLSPVAVDIATGTATQVALKTFRGNRSLDISTAAGGVVFLTTETVEPKTALELITQLGRQTRGHWAMSHGAGAARFSLLAPVAYTACVAVFDGSVTDLTTMLHAITARGATMPVTCRQVPADATSLALR